MSAGRMILLVVAIAALIGAFMLLTNTGLPGWMQGEQVVGRLADLRGTSDTSSYETDDTASDREWSNSDRADSPVPEAHPSAEPIGASTSGRVVGERIEFVDSEREVSAVGATLLGRIPGAVSLDDSIQTGSTGGGTSVGQQLLRPTGMDMLSGTLIVLDEGSNELVRYDPAHPSSPEIVGLYPLGPRRLDGTPYLQWDQVDAAEGRFDPVVGVIHVSGSPAQIVSFIDPGAQPYLTSYPDDVVALAIAVDEDVAWIAAPSGNMTYGTGNPWYPNQWMHDELAIGAREGTGASVSAAEGVFAYRYSDRDALMSYEFRKGAAGIFIHDWTQLGDVADDFESFNPPSVAFHDGRFYVTHGGGLLVLGQPDGPASTPSGSMSKYGLLVEWPTDWPAVHVAVEWPLVALTDLRNTYVLDVTDAPEIEEVARYAHGSGSDGELAMSVLDGSRLYVLNSGTGLHILELD